MYKTYKHQTILTRVISKNVGGPFFETQCIFQIKYTEGIIGSVSDDAVSLTSILDRRHHSSFKYSC